MARRVPVSIELDDLISAGCEGLLTAVQRFDPQRGLSFGAFARHRVRGAILDELRGLDPVSRRGRQSLRRVNQARRELTSELGSPPSAEQLAARVGLDLDQLEGLRMEQLRSQVVSVEALADGLSSRFSGLEPSEHPEQALLAKELRQRVASGLERLPNRQQTVLAMVYCERMTYREVAELFEVTESRICQIHRAAVGQLRAWLDERERPAGAMACA